MFMEIDINQKGVVREEEEEKKRRGMKGIIQRYRTNRLFLFILTRRIHMIMEKIGTQRTAIQNTYLVFWEPPSHRTNRELKKKSNNAQHIRDQKIERAVACCSFASPAGPAFQSTRCFRGMCKCYHHRGHQTNSHASLVTRFHKEKVNYCFDDIVLSVNCSPVLHL